MLKALNLLSQFRIKGIMRTSLRDQLLLTVMPIMLTTTFFYGNLDLWLFISFIIAPLLTIFTELILKEKTSEEDEVPNIRLFNEFDFINYVNQRKVSRYYPLYLLKDYIGSGKSKRGFLDRIIVEQEKISYYELYLLQDFKLNDEKELFEHLFIAKDQISVFNDVLALQFNGNLVLQQKYEAKGRRIYDTTLELLKRYIEISDTVNLVDREDLKARIEPVLTSNIAKASYKERLNVVEHIELILRSIFADCKMLVTKLNSLTIHLSHINTDNLQHIKEVESTFVELDILIDRTSKYDVVKHS